MIPLWLIGWGLKLRKVAAALWRIVWTPCHTTAPAWVMALFLLGVPLAVGVVKYHQGRIDGRAQIQKTIDAPITGWAARLKDCHTNVQTLIDGQAQQNAAMTKRSAEATVTLKANAKAQDAIKPQVAARQAEAARILKPLVGADVCERMFEVDRRFVETLR